MKKIVSGALILYFLSINLCFSFETDKNTIKYPNLSTFFIGEDIHEKMNRKFFDFNLKLNKIFVKQIHVLWASLFPNFLIEAVNNSYNNIEYPKRLISSLLQKDFYAIKHETKRFIINTTIGIAGIFDFASKVLNLEPFDEDMEQALGTCKIKCGNYMVLPFISSITRRDMFGRILDFILTPTTYIASPVVAAVKMGLLINRTTKIQPLLYMVQSNFADSYDIVRQIYGVEKYIKLSNYDRKNVIDKFKNDYDEVDLVDSQKENFKEVRGNIQENQFQNITTDFLDDKNLKADIILENYEPQSPVLDSMRTVLFDLNETKKDFWNIISLWNRDFSKKLKCCSIELLKDREKYRFKYILQKNKNAPLVIIFPSVGEGVNSSHSATLAEIFYNEGYSALILGNYFHWEFLKSIDKDYKLGNIQNDVKYINLVINSAIDYLSKKYNRVFLNRTAIGTSLGAYGLLFLANEQYNNGGRNIDKFIAISPPYELIYATKQIDKIISSWKNYPDNFENKIALIVAKLKKNYTNEKLKDFTNLPFNNYEAKLISAYIFHQKLADLVKTMEKEKNPNVDTKELYNLASSMDYKDYINNYLLINYDYEKLKQVTSMNSIQNYLINNKNYKIFHSLDDYLISKKQLTDLKQMCEDNLILLSNGSHLGYIYRDEFKNRLKEEIKLK